MAQPIGFDDPLKPHFVYKLNKALYGVKQAPGALFDRLCLTLQQSAFHNSLSDSSLFYSHANDIMLFVFVYVMSVKLI